jgi:hypothetical protein
MLLITEDRPTQAKLDRLAKFQKEIDALPLDANWKKELDKIWADRSRSDEFDEIKLCLKNMCPGATRCCYCEDSAAAGIEHIAPKVFYPHKTFAWDNYLYICGKCNSGKNATWAIFTGVAGKREYFKVPGKKKGQLRIFPPAGEPVLINPRVENPTDFLELVIDPKSDKLNFLPIVNAQNREDQIRADFTLRTLHLNGDDRPELAVARMQAYHDYFDRLSNYQRRKTNDQWSQSQLDQIIVRFLKNSHPTVWFEIKRIFGNGKLAKVDPYFHELLDSVPEALAW